MSEFPADPPSALNVNSATIEKLVREEIERNNKYFEFVQGQIKADREFYAHLYKYAFAFLVGMVTLATFLTSSSVSQMRSDMKMAVDATLENVRIEVKNRIDKEFRSDNIAELIAKAAKERTEKEIETIIRSETSSQVAAGIKNKENEIIGIVEAQARKLVSELEPAMEEVIHQQTDVIVKEAIANVSKQIDTFGQFIKIGNFATLARNDDRASFDYLARVAVGMKPESSNLELKKIADSTVGAIIKETTSTLRFGRTFKEKQTDDALKRFMTSNNNLERETALDNYPQGDKSILPLLVRMITDDSSIAVVYKATQRFNLLTGKSFEFWKTKDIVDWWDKNGTSFE